MEMAEKEKEAGAPLPAPLLSWVFLLGILPDSQTQVSRKKHIHYGTEWQIKQAPDTDFRPWSPLNFSVFSADRVPFFAPALLTAGGEGAIMGTSQKNAIFIVAMEKQRIQFRKSPQTSTTGGFSFFKKPRRFQHAGAKGKNGFVMQHDHLGGKGITRHHFIIAWVREAVQGNSHPAAPFSKFQNFFEKFRKRA